MIWQLGLRRRFDYLNGGHIFSLQKKKTFKMVLDKHNPPAVGKGPSHFGLVLKGAGVCDLESLGRPQFVRQLSFLQETSLCSPRTMLPGSPAAVRGGVSDTLVLSLCFPHGCRSSHTIYIFNFPFRNHSQAHLFIKKDCDHL